VKEKSRGNYKPTCILEAIPSNPKRVLSVTTQSRTDWLSNQEQWLNLQLSEDFKIWWWGGEEDQWAWSHNKKMSNKGFQNSLI